MLSFFFYGTLMDPDLRAAVLGGPSSFGCPARLSGYRRGPVAGRPYPGIAPAQGRSVEGLLIGNLTPETAARASLYEGDQYEPALLAVAAEDGSRLDAWTYLCRPDQHLAAGDWSLADWQRRHKAKTVKAARAYMTLPPDAAFRRYRADWQARSRQARRT